MVEKSATPDAPTTIARQTHPLLDQPLTSSPGTALEKKGENYLAFLHLAFAQLIFAKALVFGYALSTLLFCHSKYPCRVILSTLLLCHPERSEGSPLPAQMLRCTQHDNV